MEKRSNVSIVKILHNHRIIGLLVFHNSSDNNIIVTKKPVCPLKIKSPQFKACPNIVPWLIKIFFIDSGAYEGVPGRQWGAGPGNKVHHPIKPYKRKVKNQFTLLRIIILEIRPKSDHSLFRIIGCKNKLLARHSKIYVTRIISDVSAYCKGISGMIWKAISYLLSKL